MFVITSDKHNRLNTSLQAFKHGKQAIRAVSHGMNQALVLHGNLIAWLYAKVQSALQV